jgi:hypothetical protein
VSIDRPVAKRAQRRLYGCFRHNVAAFCQRALLRRSVADQERLVARAFTPTTALRGVRPNGGRTWWAHFECTRINIELIILPKKIEEQPVVGHFKSLSANGSYSRERRSLTPGEVP